MRVRFSSPIGAKYRPENGCTRSGRLLRATQNAGKGLRAALIIIFSEMIFIVQLTTALAEKKEKEPENIIVPIIGPHCDRVK